MIVNVLRYAVLAARSRAAGGRRGTVAGGGADGNGIVTLSDIRRGISREYHKEGRIL